MPCPGPAEAALRIQCSGLIASLSRQSFLLMSLTKWTAIDVPSVEPVVRRDFTVILEVFSRISYRRLLHSGAFFLSHFWGIEALWDRNQIHRLTP